MAAAGQEAAGAEVLRRRRGTKRLARKASGWEREERVRREDREEGGEVWEGKRADPAPASRLIKG